jgi:transcription elongation factor Elf1
MEFESEKFFTCPYCNQKISMILESLYGKQIYIEDCEICCQPIEISYEVADGEIHRLSSVKIQ